MFPGSDEDEQKCRRQAKGQFQSVWSKYAARQREIDAAALQEVDLDVVHAELDPDSDDEIYITSQDAVEVEYTRWTKEQSVPKDTVVLKYWQGKWFDYPIISQMARDYLVISAASASSERLFGNGGDILTKKRNCLASDTLR